MAHCHPAAPPSRDPWRPIYGGYGAGRMGARSGGAGSRISVRVDLRDPIEAERSKRIGYAWRAIRRGASTLALREYLFGTGADALEQGEMDTLDVLIQHRSWRMSDLAVALKVDPSTATRAVGRLVARGFAERSSSTDDGRVVLVAVTPAGASRHREVAKRRANVLGYVMGQFNQDERHALAEFLERFASALDEAASELAE